MSERTPDRDLIQRRLRTLVRLLETHAIVANRFPANELTAQECKEWARQCRTYVDLTDDELLS